MTEEKEHRTPSEIKSDLFALHLSMCRDKHSDLKEVFRIIDARIKRLENRFVATLTMLIMNLAGVISILLMVLFNKKVV